MSESVFVVLSRLLGPVGCCFFSAGISDATVAAAAAAADGIHWHSFIFSLCKTTPHGRSRYQQMVPETLPVAFASLPRADNGGEGYDKAGKRKEKRDILENVCLKWLGDTLALTKMSSNGRKGHPTPSKSNLVGKGKNGIHPKKKLKMNEMNV